jgi:hypothetical protein
MPRGVVRRRFRHADPHLIGTRLAGYELRLGAHRLDVARFRLLAERGRRAAEAGDHPASVALLDDALALWRGPALAEVADELAGEVRRALHRERFAAIEARMDAYRTEWRGVLDTLGVNEGCLLLRTRPARRAG